MGFLDYIPLVGDVVNGVANIVGTAMTNKANRNIADQTNQTQLEIAEKANQNNLDLWHLNADYNSLAQQVQRAREAGFSANSLLESSGYNSVSSAPSPTVVPQMQMGAPMVNPIPPNMVGSIMEDLKTFAEIKNIDEQTKQQKTQNEFTRERIALELRAAGLENVAKDIQNRITKKTEDDTVSMAKATLEKMYADKALTDEQMMSYKIANSINQEFGYQLSEAELNKKVQEVNKLIQDRHTSLSQEELNKALGKKASSGALLDYLNGQVAKQTERLTRIDADWEEQLSKLGGNSKAAKLILELIKLLK